MQQEKILIIRNDRLGDFILSLPSFALLKQSKPNILVYALVPAYTAPIARQCPWIDGVIIDKKKNIIDFFSLLNTIKKHRFSDCISLFLTSRIGLLLWLANISYRLAPANKLAQIFYNHKLQQKRSFSIKPEYAYNLDLISHFLLQNRNNLLSPHKPFILLDVNKQQTIRTKFINMHKLNSWLPMVFVHINTGGSACSLNKKQWCDLMELIAINNHINLVFTTEEAGKEKIYAVVEGLKKVNIEASVHISTAGLLHFSYILNCCDIFISPSTGPAHIAAALNKATIMFFSPHHTAGVARWKTINDVSQQLNITAPLCHMRNQELLQLNMQDVYHKKISPFIKSVLFQE